MHLSREALELCAKKYDRGRLKGFGFKEEMSFEQGTEVLKKIFKELLAEDMITEDKDYFRISPFGESILNMVISPDIYIEIQSHVRKENFQLYIRGTYYLMILEDKEDVRESISGYTPIKMFLLPTLREMVSAFTHMLHYKGEQTRQYEIPTLMENDILVCAKAFGEPDNYKEFYGNYRGETIVLKDATFSGGGKDVLGEERNVVEFINCLTKWTFDNLRRISEKEGLHGAV